MSHSIESVAAKYLNARKLSPGTCKEYRGTVTKWTAWGKGVNVDQIGRVHLRDFLDWVHEKAVADGGSNAGRTANKSRENLRAILSWAWEQDYLENLWLIRKNLTHNIESTVPEEVPVVWPWTAAFGELDV